MEEVGKVASSRQASPQSPPKSPSKIVPQSLNQPFSLSDSSEEELLDFVLSADPQTPKFEIESYLETESPESSQNFEYSASEISNGSFKSPSESLSEDFSALLSSKSHKSKSFCARDEETLTSLSSSKELPDVQHTLQKMNQNPLTEFQFKTKESDCKCNACSLM